LSPLTSIPTTPPSVYSSSTAASVLGFSIFGTAYHSQSLPHGNKAQASGRTSYTHEGQFSSQSAFASDRRIHRNRRSLTFDRLAWIESWWDRGRRKPFQHSAQHANQKEEVNVRGKVTFYYHPQQGRAEQKNRQPGLM
ncbi:hypothetical protein PoB_006133500, partial [Plakobranchus ocellatus]